MKKIKTIFGKIAEISGSLGIIIAILLLLDEFRVFGGEWIYYENASLTLVNSVEHIARDSRGSIRFLNPAGAVQILHSDGNFAYFSNIGPNRVPNLIEVKLDDKSPAAEPIRLRDYIPQSILSKVENVRRDSWIGMSSWRDRRKWTLHIEVDLSTKRVDWLLEERSYDDRRSWYRCASKTEMYQGLAITGNWRDGPVFPNCRL